MGGRIGSRRAPPLFHGTPAAEQSQQQGGQARGVNERDVEKETIHCVRSKIESRKPKKLHALHYSRSRGSRSLLREEFGFMSQRLDGTDKLRQAFNSCSNSLPRRRWEKTNYGAARNAAMRFSSEGCVMNSAVIQRRRRARRSCSSRWQRHSTRVREKCRFPAF